jgi:hypothetical protein
MTKFPTCLLLASTLAAGACTVTTSQDIDPTQLSGVVDGVPWTFQAGETDAFLSENQDDFFATLYASSYTPCSDFDPSGPHLIVSIPKAAGDYTMGLSRSMTFVDGDLNMVAVDGRIVVDEVTSDHVSGGLHGTYDIDNEVSGQFDLHVCQ